VQHIDAATCHYTSRLSVTDCDQHSLKGVKPVKPCPLVVAAHIGPNCPRAPHQRRLPPERVGILIADSGLYETRKQQWADESMIDGCSFPLLYDDHGC
jgi:hypothetical protein